MISVQWSPIAKADHTADKTIYFIEENWELTLSDPEPEINSPQVSFFVFPDSRYPERYFELQMNYAVNPQYSDGGFRVNAVVDSETYDEQRSPLRTKWTTDGDVVRWTSVVAVRDAKFLFAVKEGHSSDWGAFGGPEYLVSMPVGQSTGLSRYHPQESLANTTVSFGSNRIDAIVLKSVDITYTDGSKVHVVADRTATIR